MDQDTTTILRTGRDVEEVTGMKAGQQPRLPIGIQTSGRQADWPLPQRIVFTKTGIIPNTEQYHKASGK